MKKSSLHTLSSIALTRNEQTFIHAGSGGGGGGESDPGSPTFTPLEEEEDPSRSSYNKISGI